MVQALCETVRKEGEHTAQQLQRRDAATVSKSAVEAMIAQVCECAQKRTMCGAGGRQASSACFSGVVVCARAPDDERKGKLNKSAPESGESELLMNAGVFAPLDPSAKMMEHAPLL